MSLSKRLRYEILNRDNFTCRYCGGQPPDVILTVDHVLPTALGGSDEPANLTAACKDCNAGKSSMKPGSPVVDGVTRDAERWANVIYELVEFRSSEIERMENIYAWFDHEWCKWVSVRTNEPLVRTGDWRRTVEIWVARGLSLKIIAHHIPTAMNANADDTWRYYCGIIWGVIRVLDKEASSRISAEDDVELFNPDRLMALIF